MTLTTTWADPLWWNMALSGGFFILSLYVLAVLARQLQVKLRLLRARPLQQWRQPKLSWSEYRKQWGSLMFGQLATWIVLYGLVLAVFNMSQGFVNALVQYLVFAAVVLGPFAIATLALTWWKPTSYALTDVGVGSVSWSLFSVGRTAGLQDSSYRPWANIKGYYWSEGNLVLVAKRGFLSPERFTLVVPPGERRNLEDVLRDRGLTKVPKDNGDRQGKGRSSRSRDRSGGGGRGR